MREKRMVEPKNGRCGVPRLHAAAAAARKEALEHLGEAAASFTASISRYVNAVEVADTARREWERLDRPMMHRFANGVEGIHSLISTMAGMDKAAAAFGASLGLDPMSRKRLLGPGQAGRPIGAVSADDRKAEPPVLTRNPRLPPLTLRSVPEVEVFPRNGA
jgi:hypothetical protein